MTKTEEKTKAEDAPASQNPMQKLEDALVICTFGKFHIRLLLATLTGVMAFVMVTTTSSYILPNAECDLHMNNMQKGLLNAMPFFGQVASALFTGFLVDAFGRKMFLVSGHAGIFVCTLLEGSSQTYWMLIFIKLIQGILISVCFSTIATMVSEFVHKNVRDRVLMTYCSFMPLSLVTAALISWGLLPNEHWQFVVWEGYFEIRVWNIYLWVNSIWSLIATLLYASLPESPKFLLSHGQENQALEICKQIYYENTGKTKESFPITSLKSSDTFEQEKEISMKKQLTNALFEVKELFRKPLIYNLILFSSLTFVCLLAYSALRLWYPQLSTVVEHYQQDHGETARFCVMMGDYAGNLNVNISVTNNVTEAVCVPHLSGSETYINGILLGITSLVCIAISGYLVDFLGQKLLMFILLILCTVCSSAMYWANSSIQIAMLVSATCGFMQTALSLQQNILVRVFPTTLRVLALSIIIMVGRIGSLLGNILFPVFLEAGCMVPFLTLAGITLCVAALVYFMPNPTKDNKSTGDK